MLRTFEDVVDVVVSGSYYIDPFGCDGRRPHVVIIEVNGGWMKAIEASA